jgi:excinuclease ABC subunit A
VRGRKGEYRKELAELQKKGFQRAKIDGSSTISAPRQLWTKTQARYRDRVDRIVVKPDIGNRLPDPIETALGLPTASWWWNSPRRKRTPNRNRSSFLKFAVRCRVSPFRKLNRGCFPSTTPRRLSGM